MVVPLCFDLGWEGILALLFALIAFQFVAPFLLYLLIKSEIRRVYV